MNIYSDNAQKEKLSWEQYQLLRLVAGNLFLELTHEQGQVDPAHSTAGTHDKTLPTLLDLGLKFPGLITNIKLSRGHTVLKAGVGNPEKDTSLLLLSALWSKLSQRQERHLDLERH